MFQLKSKILVSSAILFAQQAYAAEPLLVSSIDWCPQLCSTGDKEGYVMDTVKAVFKDSPYQVKVTTFPWSRAIKSVEKGQAQALLAPAKQEAPNLMFPTQEVGIQRMCFFTKSHSDWTYSGPESLTGLKVGLAQDTSIEELNSFIADNPDQFDFIPYSDSYLDISIKKTKFDRIDAFLFTYNSTQYELSNMQLNNEFREAGCTSTAKIYMAFTPDAGQTSDVKEMMDYFDQEMKSLKASGEIKNIMAKYGLSDWQDFL